MLDNDCDPSVLPQAFFFFFWLPPFSDVTPALQALRRNFLAPSLVGLPSTLLQLLNLFFLFLKNSLNACNGVTTTTTQNTSAPPTICCIHLFHNCRSHDLLIPLPFVIHHGDKRNKQQATKNPRKGGKKTSRSFR
jgi:hypothetical protein